MGDQEEDLEAIANVAATAQFCNFYYSFSDLRSGGKNFKAELQGGGSRIFLPLCLGPQGGEGTLVRVRG